MKRTLQLLLTENVDGLGIVGDVVDVKTGYARNFLLPRGYATQPSEEAMAELAERRQEAEKQVAALRAERERIVGKLDGLGLTIERSCNDFGMLYGSVTQRDVAKELGEKGYSVKPREVRLSQAIKRVDSYEIPIKLDADLEATIKLTVKADRELPTDDDRLEMEFDNEGNLIEPGSRKSAFTADGKLKPVEGEGQGEGQAEGDEAAKKPADGAEAAADQPAEEQPAPAE